MSLGAVRTRRRLSQRCYTIYLSALSRTGEASGDLTLLAYNHLAIAEGVHISRDLQRRSVAAPLRLSTLIAGILRSLHGRAVTMSI